jgi:hypothetical protein
MTSIEAEMKLADDDRQFALKYIENNWKDESDDKKFGFEMGVLIGYNKAKETLYTEEQVRDIVLKFAEESTFLRQGIAIKWVKNYFQSLKQPKQ